MRPLVASVADARVSQVMGLAGKSGFDEKEHAMEAAYIRVSEEGRRAGGREGGREGLCVCVVSQVWAWRASPGLTRRSMPWRRLTSLYVRRREGGREGGRDKIGGREGGREG